MVKTLTSAPAAPPGRAGDTRMKTPARIAMAAGLGLLAATPAVAAVEDVLLTVAGTDGVVVVVERASGERWRLDLGQDCLAIRALAGRMALLWTPSGAVTLQARLLVPEQDLACSVLRADTLGPAPRPWHDQEAPVAGLRALRQALERLGYDCGPVAAGWTPEATQAFLLFRQSRRLDTSTRGLRRAIASLALEVMRGRQVTGTALKLSQTLSEQSDLLVAYLSRAGSGSSSCGPPTYVATVASDGSVVTLGDGSRWRPAADAWRVVAGWQNGDEALACGGRLVNGRTGEMVRAVAMN